MLGLSYGEIFLILGATAALIGPKDLPMIARTAGRLSGRAIGYVQLARGQFDHVMQHTQLRQVNKELQDTLAQVDAIRQQINSFSIMNPGPLTRTLMDNPDQTDINPGASIQTGPLNPSEESPVASTQHRQYQQNQESFKTETSVFKDYDSITSGPSNLHSRATTYARFAESGALKVGDTGGSLSMQAADDRPGLLSVLPVSAQSAGLLPSHQGEVTGSDIVLEAVLEAEVARNAREFFSQPQNQIKCD